MRGDRASGFTLIELMVVLAIMGVLMAVAIPVLRTRSGAVDAGRTGATLDEALAAARAAARTTGTPQSVATRTIAADATYTDWRGRRADAITVFPDGSSSGGSVSVSGRSVASIDWLTGAVVAAR